MAELLFLSSAERDWAIENLEIPDRIHYLPFGVDTQFWNTEQSSVRNTLAVPREFVFSIGSDPNRDFKLLLRCWDETWPHLLIITSLNLPNIDKKNITVICGSVYNKDIGDAEIKWLYQNASFVVLPTTDCWQPSGQSCLYQAMASGAVCVAGSNCFGWDCALAECEGILSYSEGNLSSFEKAVRKAIALSSNEKKVMKIGLNNTINRFFSSEKLTKNLIELLG